MPLIRVEEQIDISAPPGEVFALITDIEKRMQLSPWWGSADIEDVSADYPRRDSSYRLKPRQEDLPAYEVQVVAYQPGEALVLEWDGETTFRQEWRVHRASEGARLSYAGDHWYEEDPAEVGGEQEDALEQALSPTLEPGEKAAQEAREWLTNLKRYVELRPEGIQRWVKWFLDRYLLKLRAEQRRVIFILFAFQLVTFLTFLVAAIGLGIAWLFFR